MSDALCQELAGVSELVNAQVAAGQSRDDVMEAMFSSFMVRLSAATHVTGSKQKLAVTKAITAGPWSAEHRKDLADCVLQTGSGGGSKAMKAARRPQQRAHKIEHLVPTHIMLKLRDPAYSLLSKLSLVSGAGRALGIELADDKTIWRMLGLVAYQSDKYDMTQGEIWTHMNTTQTYLQSAVRAPVEFITEYPPNAAQCLWSYRRAATRARHS